MPLNRLAIAMFVGAVLAVAVGLGLQSAPATAESMTQNATAWLSTLDEEQLAQATYPYDAEERVGWHFIPKDTRKGVAVRKMNDEQKDAARKLLASCLSASGYRKVREVFSLEALLFQIQEANGGQGPERDAAKYYFTIFGSPDGSDRWGLSIEGHHLSLNFVVEGDEVISASPHFLAANPTLSSKFVPAKGNPWLVTLQRGGRPLVAEEVLAFDLIHALDEEQQSEAIIAAKAPAEIRAAGEAQPPQEDAAGISYRKLDNQQQSRLQALIRSYAGNLPRDVSAKLIAEIRDAGWGKVHFAWAGATQPGIGHYYRIQGPTFLIEFVNTQPDAEGNPASHIHCVWRDPRGDFALPIGG